MSKRNYDSAIEEGFGILNANESENDTEITSDYFGFTIVAIEEYVIGEEEEE